MICLLKHSGQFGKKTKKKEEEEKKIDQEKHLLAAAQSRLCCSMEERLVLEDEMRGSRDFLATNLDLSKGEIGFSIKMVGQFGN